MLRPLLLTLLLLSLAAEGVAQNDPLYVSSQQAPVRISIGAVYQSYTEDDNTLSEFSIPLALSIPVGSNFGISLLASQASATGDLVADLSGLSDAQVGLSYHGQIGEGSVVVSLGANLPSGKRELTAGEFETAIFLSQHFYSFRVPGFGQGFNIAPGIVFAFPVAEGVVLGAGASYQRKGSYKPLDGMQDDYDPGDEILLTGGFDYRLGTAANLSADVTYTVYGNDALGDAEVYQAGNKVTATVQVLSYLGPHELRLVGRLRSAAKSSRPAVLGATDEELRALPAQALFYGSYRHQLSQAFTLGILAQARLFDETDVFASKSLFDVGLAPAVRVSDTVVLRVRALYTLGDFTGFEAGGGLVIEL